jgi:uncharacterized membrane protein YdjX (TVP38/TMEM64 family)
VKEEVIQLFNSYPGYAVLISLAINVLVAVLGVIPSVFLTAANVLFFGFWQGTLISFAGEALGAFISFILYRFGFKSRLHRTVQHHPTVKKLLDAEGLTAFYAIVSLRLLPFVPSGLITFASAIGRVSLSTFFIASSLGKAPALLLEAYAAYQVTAFGWQGKLILLAVAIYFLVLVYKKVKRKTTN